MAVDLENVRERLAPLFGLLRALDPENAVLHLVGTPWAQDLADDRRIVGDWDVRRDVNSTAMEAADDVIHQLLDRWRVEGRVAVVASSDGGFAESLLAHRRAGLQAFLVAVERPARRLRDAAEVFVLSQPGATEEAAEAIEAAR